MPETLPLSRSRCYNHPTREAVALCTVTGKPFCRECIVEHEGRMVSAEVVAGLLKKKDGPTRVWWKTPFQWCATALSFLLLCYGFYLLGRILLQIPARFHEGNYW